MKKELDLNGKIRNLQVSISIYKKEINDLQGLIPTLKAIRNDDTGRLERNPLKNKKIDRLDKVVSIVRQKENELFDLKSIRVLHQVG